MHKPLLALTALFAAAPLQAQPITAAEQAQIDKVVSDTLDHYSVPSASIAIVRDGKIVLAKAYGKASETIPVARPDLPYQIASNSKQFTAMAMLLLEDDGKLDLDDKVAKYVPGISGADRITLRQLLDHTSGLQDYWPQDFSFPDMARPTTPQGIVDKWAKKPLDFQPGDQWQYSNTAYVVAGMVIEKVSGEPLFAFLKRRIFTPLGMTSVEDMDRTNGPRFPQGYGRNALGPVRPVTPPAPGWLYAAGELSMSATDLAKWNIARINRAVLPRDDWEEQEVTTKLNSGKDSGYGLGVFVRDSNGRRIVSHGGESVGFLSASNVYPNERASIVVLTNSWSGAAYGAIARQLSQIVLPKAQAAQGAALTRARTVYDQLRRGTLDRQLLTANANYYFTPQVQADFRTSLGPLGEPTAFEADGNEVLRGGFVIQSYAIKYPGRTLSLSTFREPGENGRIEQFLVSPE
ncbi:beta-lactamase family protein [Sphingomonas rhizophila]|uniref:Beta-lactamase family protein n=1 Tax=Sphingomonas rhizophila TaxID=2071607 RepID=A0A7G9S8B0_9SPHN|nr:serine hydrolase domain-containing protein [Sphingomonas rhizophila]QNN64085.1 beta-lactamase family protein [Sphingomonas rhizophila]